MLSSYSKSHQTFFGGWTNQFTGNFNSYYNNWTYFFTLKETNAKLIAENIALRNELAQNFVGFDTTKKAGSLILRKDSLEKIRKFYYYPAKVVGNTFTLQQNYITIERGALQGVKKDMAAISPDGTIVGVVVEWDGSDPSMLTLKNISKSAAPKIGDTVLTSPYSSNFPAQMFIGRVTNVIKDPSSNFLTLNVKSATNFYNLEYVYLVENKRMAEQQNVEQINLKNE
jgi:rod shape-determining protein MreC